MRIEQLLDSEIKSKLGYSDESKGKVQSKGKKRNNRNTERLSERDLKELMGVNKPTFKKKNGAWRSK